VIRLLILAFCASLAIQPAGRKPITLDDFLSQPAAHSLAPIWAPDGKSFAYEEKGNVYRYDVSKRKAQSWFAAKAASAKDTAWQNRRVSSQSYQWFPNGKDLLAAEEGDLFVVAADGKRERITETGANEEDPKLSPDGKRVLYRSKSNLYVLDLATKQIRQLTRDGTGTLLNGQLDWVYPEELELHTATWWAPDSRQIAYLQFDVSHEFSYPQLDLLGERAIAEPQRYPQAGTPNAHVRLGVLSLESGLTKWMEIGDTSDALLARVAWLPDSSEVAVERMNRVQNELDLLFCNPSSGAARVVLHEQSKTWINMADNLFLLKSRPEFLWTSEVPTGFRHIYRYSNKGEMLRQITSGNWEVRSIAAVDEANQRVLFTSSEQGPLENQLYAAGFDGGTRSRLTKDAGVHDIHANSDGSYYVDAFSNSERPPETVLRNPAGEQLDVLVPMDRKQLETYQFPPAEIIEVKAKDGTVLYGRLTKPSDFREGVKYPLIVYVYGGPGVQEIRNEWQSLDWQQVLADRGYLVWQLENRGSKGRGHAFEAPIYRELGKQEVADQRLGVEYLLGKGFVAPERVGITGWSYGGYMTIHCMLLAPDVFKVGVAGAPVNDWRNYDTIYTERYMDTPANNRARYDSASNVPNAAKLRGRLLIVHNFEDDNVLFQNTMQMANALEKANKRFVMQIYPQKTHGVSGTLRKPLYEEMTAFFDEHLKGSVRY
jgi:dipeptidyl-peptidase 4